MFREDKAEIGFLVTKAQKSIKRLITTHLKKYNLTLPQFIILRRLYQGDGISSQELNQMSAIDSATLVPIIDKLKLRKLIVKCPDPEDRRSHNLHLTEKGKILIKKALVPVKKAEQTIESEFLSNELESLKKGLIKIYLSCDAQLRIIKGE